ncbi:UNVERIFIED_CONTAM: Retrovirus-related Pol polyprotein from transposon RE2 [Sesamum radiatum]|uniref:Retrovirus-related Pol polyprotein from transposon RE2 n=1 Tax=Sesamum radiatum TaxID=300843 RepID=A0AAW2K9Y2_SESRA
MKKDKGTTVTATASTGGAPPAAPKERAKRRLGVLSGRRQMMCVCSAKERGILRGSVHNSFPIQVLERSRKLSKDEMVLRLGDGKAVAAEAVGSLSLVSTMTTQHKRKVNDHENAQIWHARLGHISKDRIRRVDLSIGISRVPERYGFVGLTCQLDNDPKMYGEAMSDIDLDKWFETMKFKMNSMGSNQVWTLVDPPKGARLVGCKWVYKRKLGADGEVIAFKARLVAKGYTQRPGVDFEETYSPVAMAKSIRILLAIAAWYDYEIWQMDVKTAFLNGFVKE